MTTRAPRSLERWRRDAVRHIEATRRATLALLPRLTEAEIREPRTQGRWSIKDLLAHLTTCDEETVRRFKLIARGRADRIHWFESVADMDRFNARCVARARRLGLGVLRRRMERAHADVVRWLERLPAAALDYASHKYTVVDWLPEPGWTHERDHMREAKAWWKAKRRRSWGRRSSRR